MRYLVVEVPNSLENIVQLTDPPVSPPMAALVALAEAYRRCPTTNARRMFLLLAGFRKAYVVTVA